MRFPRVKAEVRVFATAFPEWSTVNSFPDRPPRFPGGRKICATDATGWSLLAAYDEIVEPFWVSGAGIEVA